LPATRCKHLSYIHSNAGRMAFWWEECKVFVRFGCYYVLSLHTGDFPFVIWAMTNLK
jgi:hypothetical protein